MRFNEIKVTFVLTQINSADIQHNFLQAKSQVFNQY